MSTLTPTPVTLEDLIDVTSKINVLNDGIETQASSPRTKDLEDVTVQVYDDPTVTALYDATTDGTTASHLIDASALFLTDGTVSVGDSVVNDTDKTYALVTAIADGDLTLSADIFITGEDYRVIPASFWSQKNLLGEWIRSGNQSGNNKLVAYTLPVNTASTVVGEIVYPIALAGIGTYPPTT